MIRQVRIEYPGAIYHGMARGTRREAIVLDDEDRDRFRKLLGDLVQQLRQPGVAPLRGTNLGSGTCGGSGENRLNRIFTGIIGYLRTND
jgi:hypothetical protein